MNNEPLKYGPFEWVTISQAWIGHDDLYIMKNVYLMFYISFNKRL